MLVIIGTVIVLSSVIGGFLFGGGHLATLWQPGEFLIIFGAALGAWVIGTPMNTVKKMLKSFGPLFRGPRYNKKSYLDLLCLLYTLFRLAKTKGDLALESHVERPKESQIFQQFPKVLSNHEGVEFLCDYLRLLTLGTNNAHEVETIIDAEIEGEHHEGAAVAKSIADMADGMPALGIVAAVLGVIHTMGSITQPPEVLGGLIGAALVGTFIGVLAAYGFVAPMARAMDAAYGGDTEYLNCMKAAILSHMQGYAPRISIELARKTLTPAVKPSFEELEVAIGDLSSSG